MLMVLFVGSVRSEQDENNKTIVAVAAET